MPDTDTQSRVTTFVPPIVVQSRYEPYSRSIRNFSYATSTHHERCVAFEAALAKAGIAKWTLYEILEASDEATIKRIFLEYFDGEPSKLFPDKTEQELNSTVPKEVIDAYLPHIDELHNAQQHDERLFAKQLTANFFDQLRRQHIPLPAEVENRMQARVEGVLPDIVRTSETLSEVENKVKNYLVSALAFIPETQPIVASQQTTLEAASQEALTNSRPTIIGLMARPEILTRTIVAPVIDKTDFEKILTQLVTQTPTISVDRHAIQAETLVRTLEATNATIVGADAARATGQLLISLAQESNKPLGVAAAALLSPQTRDRIFEAIAARSWEAAVDNITKKAAALALDQNILQDIVRRGNETFGVSTGKGGAVAARGLAEALWGNITGPMENYIVSQHNLAKLTGTQIPTVTNSAEFFMTLLYVQGSSAVTMHGEGQKEGGGFLKFVLSWGAEEGAAKLINKGVTTVAGGTVKEVVKKGVTSFVTGLLTRVGLTALASTVAPVVGTIVAVAVQAVVWLGGFIVRPLLNWVGGLLRGEKLPFGIGAAVTGLSDYFRSATGSTGAERQERAWWIALFVVIFGVILLPVLPIIGPTLSPTQQITTRNAALLTSYNAALGGGDGIFDPNSTYPDGAILLPDNIAVGQCPVENGNAGTGSYDPDDGGHGNSDYWGPGGPSYEIPIRSMMPDIAVGCSNPSCPYYGFALDVGPVEKGGHPPVAIPQICSTTGSCASMTWTIDRLWVTCATGVDKPTAAECGGPNWGHGVVLSAQGNGHSWKLYLNHIDPRPGLAVGQTYQTEDVIGNMTTVFDNSHVHIEAAIDGIPVRPESLHMCGT